MSTDLAPLDDLAGRINAEHAACLGAARDAVERAIEVGRLLAEAKRQVRHGAWAAWVDTNCSFGPRQAQLYMQTYRERDALREQMRNGAAHLTSMRGAIEAVAEPKAVERAVDAVLEKHGFGIKPLPGQMSFLPGEEPGRGDAAPAVAIAAPKPKPPRHELMKKWLHDLQVIVMTVNAADTPEQRGWGGMAAVRKEMRRRDLQLIRGSIKSLIESLQEWLELLEVPHESTPDEA